MRLRPSDIQQQTFRTAFRGFDPVEVDGFLNRVADELERLIEERTALEGELSHEKAIRSQVEEAMAAARHLQESILEKAKEDARVTMNQAKLLADRLVAEAGEEIAALRKEARLLQERRAEALADLAGMAQRLAHWAETMRTSAPPPMPAVPAPEAVETPAPAAPEWDPAGFFRSAEEQELPLETVEIDPAGDPADASAEAVEELLLEERE